MTSSVPDLRASAVSFSSTFSSDSFVDDDCDEHFLDENDGAIWMETDYDAEDEVDQAAAERDADANGEACVRRNWRG